METKRKIFVTILIIWMIVIFGFSNQSVTTSLSLSDKVADKIINVGLKITKKEISIEKRSKLIKKMRFIVRKTAHFTEYFILGVLIYCIFCMYSVPEAFLCAILFCLLYACSDEFHQLFSDGRSAKIMDVFIDTSGSVLSIGICTLLNKRRKLHKNLQLLEESNELN